MLVKKCSFLAALLLAACMQTPEEDTNLQLRYTAPAAVWEETLPLGNGRLGLMPDGGIQTQTLVLNDITLWSGSEQDATNNLAQKDLPTIRQLLLEGKNDQAQELMYKGFVCGGVGSGRGNGANVPFGCFQTLGLLTISHTNITQEVVPDYQRRLNLNTAIAETQWKGVKREYFCSFADDVAVIYMEEKEGINAVLRLSRPERFSVETTNDQLIMKGALSSGVEGVEGMRYISRLSVVATEGTVTYAGDSVVLENVKKAVIISSSATNYKQPEYEKRSQELLQQAMAIPYGELKKRHMEAYREKFSRVVLTLGDAAQQEAAMKPTIERLAAQQEQDDPAFAALYYQFGRYLLICSAREGLLPPNLQGLWANTVQTPWNGDYHLNINVQMNHWIAEAGNLSELHTPLIDFTQSLVPSGQVTAQSFYNANGWTAHVVCNPWLFTAPGEHPSWGASNTGGGWLCQHLWQHYLYTLDKEYLASVYPTLKGACEFFLSSLIEEPSHKWLVTAPTTSPENAYYMPNGKIVSICMGSTMDNQIVAELFDNTAAACAILGIDTAFKDTLENTRKRLAPAQVSPEGYLQEWLEDYKETDIHHRHVSHLYGLHPSNQITQSKTPELMDACRATLERRGDGGTGWSRAWKVNFWARLGDGDRALKLLKSLWTPALTKKNETTYNGAGSGTYPNLFCAHPPFQIDGNFGGAAGIGEMLLQSHDGFIHLLPALPRSWATGNFSGMKVEGNGEVSCRWSMGRVDQVTLLALSDNTYLIRKPADVVNVTLLTHTKGSVSVQDSLITATLLKGEHLTINFAY